MDIRKILDIISEAEKPLQEFMDTGGGDDGDDEMAQRIIDMYFEDGLRETEIAKLEGIPEVEVHNIIIKYLNGDRPMDGLDEAEKPLAKGMKVMSLAQFLQQSGVEPPKEEQVNELSPKTKKSYSAAAKDDKKFNDNSIEKAKRMSKEQPHKKAEWEDEIEFLKSVNAKRDRGLARAGVAEGAPELLKKEMPLVRHIDKILAGHGYKKGTPEYDEHFKQAISYLRKFGNIDQINKQGVAEGEVVSMKNDTAMLHRLAKDWWHGDSSTYAKATKMLEKMGWEIYEDDDEIVLSKGDDEMRISMDDLSEGLDEAEKLGGVSARTLPKDELTSYLDRIIGKSKEKTDKYKLPYIHGSNIPIVNQDGEKYDLKKLAATFTQRPTKILKQNEKMQHSDGTTSQFYNVGLPALKGLAVDEDTGEFVVIDTCPGAGACKLVCYAMKGGYIQYPASNLGMTRLLNFLYNDPDGFMGMLESEISAYEAKNKKKNIKTIIRWHDAGDFFSPQYLSKAYELAKKFPDVDFYAYTKLAGVAQGEKPDNFKINFSAGAQPSQEKKIDFQKTKNSRIVPKELFSDALEKDNTGKWQYTSPQAQQAVKDRMAIKYSLDPKSVITYDEMMKIPVDKSPDAKGKWNVIVKPGDGDDAANRNDVLSSLLLIH